MQPKRILISGAGVAGLSAAFWFVRAGADVTVLERGPKLRDGGYAVDIRGAASEVVRRMGLHGTLRELESGVDNVRFIGRNGSVAATMPSNVLEGRTEGDLGIMRGDLLRALREATGTDVDIRFGRTIRSVDDNQREVHVSLDNGERVTVDLLIAADGTHSPTRASIGGSGKTSVVDLRAMIAISEVPGTFSVPGCEEIFAGPGWTVGVYPTRENSARAMFLFRPNAEGPDARQTIEHAFGHVRGWKVPDLLASLPAAEDIYLDRLVTAHAPRYFSGRQVLLGDAAHTASPASGQGTSLALVGAYVLARSVIDTGSLKDGLHVYESTMRPFAEANIRLAKSAVQGMVMNRAFTVARDVMFLLPDRVFVGMNAAMAKQIQKAANAITLPA